jgi:hypothetical protein
MTVDPASTKGKRKEVDTSKDERRIKKAGKAMATSFGVAKTR